MRPPDLPGGNAGPAGRHRVLVHPGFNEAAGFTRRKLSPVMVEQGEREWASMRPPDLPGGNPMGQRTTKNARRSGFNEAAGFTRRKLEAPRIYGAGSIHPLQ